MALPPPRDLPSLQSLPVDLKRRVASFLDPNDALQLSPTCRQIHTELGLTPMKPPVELVSTQTFSGGGSSGFRLYTRIPVLRHCHSATITFQICDLGWSRTPESRIYIVAKGEETHDDDDDKSHSGMDRRFNGGRLVFESPSALLEDEPSKNGVRVTLIPQQPGESYYLWYNLGKGPGHFLNLKNLQVRMLLFDDPQRNLSRSIRKLSNAGILIRKRTSGNHFYQNQILTTARALRQRFRRHDDDEEPENMQHLVNCFQWLQMDDVNEVSLQAVEEVIQDLNVEGVVEDFSEFSYFSIFMKKHTPFVGRNCKGKHKLTYRKRRR